MTETQKELASKTRFGWRTLLGMSAGLFVASLGVRIITEGLDRRMLVISAIGLIGLVLVRFSPQMAVQALVVAVVGFLYVDSAFLAVALRSLASPGNFILAIVLTVAGLTTLFAALPTYRQAPEVAETSSLPKLVGIVAGSLVLLTAIMSLYSTITFVDPKPKERDLQVETRGFRYEPPRLITLEGTVGIHATNRDETLHTLTIPSLDIDLSLLPGRSVRVEVKAKSGTYPFSCRRHPEMKGEVFLRKPGASDLEDFLGNPAGG